MFRKKITGTRPFSNNVEEVIYADGSKGYRSIDSGPAQQEIQDQSLDKSPQHAMEWDSAQDEPASQNEMSDIEEQLKKARG